jgi:DNA-binding transcriptional MerR regulator
MFETFFAIDVRNSDMQEGQFTSAQVIALTGITPRQLQWWDERKVVVPARQGRRRLYTSEQLTEVAVICDLRRKGFSLQRVRKLMRALQREFGKRLVEVAGRSDECHLLTDGRSIYVKTSAEQVVDVLKNARQPMLAVCLSDAVRLSQGPMAEGGSADSQGNVNQRNAPSGRKPVSMARVAGKRRNAR